MQRRKYSQEFKREAVAPTNQSGITMKRIGEQFGINEDN
jgi:transposase-like protein